MQLTGTTPAPDERVVIYTRGAGAKTYAKHAVTRSDASGAFAKTFTERSTTRYYAQVGTAKSLTRTTRLVTASCRAGGPVFRRGPIPVNYSPPLKYPYAFAALTATRGGLWAGYAYIAYPLTFAVISWRKGEHNATVLRTYRMGSGEGLPNHAGTVSIAGIRRDGTVVAAIQHDRNDASVTRGYAFHRGHTYVLKAHPSWTSVHPSAVTDNGTIVGWAQATVHHKSRYYLVSWARPSSQPRVLMTFSHHDSPVWNSAVDGLGDVAWNTDAGTQRVRLASGRVRTLEGPDGSSTTVEAASGHYVYGAKNDGVYRWDLASVSPSGPVLADRRLNGTVDATISATSARGGVISGINHETYRLSSGAITSLPSQPGVNGIAGQAIDSRGTVAYTSTRDGLPHLLSCH